MKGKEEPSSELPALITLSNRKREKKKEKKKEKSYSARNSAFFELFSM